MKIPALVVLACLSAHTQTTTYPQSNVPFVCHAASKHRITSFYEFQCRGLYYNNDNIEFFFQGGSRIEFAQASPLESGSGSITSVPVFTLPGHVPGTFKANWEFTDQHRVVHTGSTFGTWVELVDHLGWHHPKLLSSSITVD
jgi:hypothetical protein